MPEVARISGGRDCFELDIPEREATPEPTMKCGINRFRSTVHNGVQEADLWPSEGKTRITLRSMKP